MTRCGKLEVRKHTPLATRGEMEGSILPEGSGDAESPASPEATSRALAVYDARLSLLPEAQAAPKKKRRFFHEYTAKNCEEAWGGR